MLLLAYTYREERAAAASQLQNNARAMSIVVDRQLAQAEAVMQALATAPSLLSGDFDSFDRQARAANPIPGSWIVVRDMTGVQRVNTRLPPGAPLPVDKGVAEQISSLVAGGPRISNLIPRSAIGKPVFGIDVPVVRDGAVAYDLAIVIQPSIFDRVFTEQRLSPGWLGSIIDREGYIVRRSHDGDQTVGHEISPAFRARLKGAATEGLFESESLEGVRTLLAYSRSPSSGWVFAVAVPRELFGTAARRSLYLAVIIGIGLIGFTVLVARNIAGGIARPVDGLVDHAAAMGRGELIPQVETGLAEADLVAGAMRKAGASIRGFTATLEQRVAERTRDLAETIERDRRAPPCRGATGAGPADGGGGTALGRHRP
jgi:hypothetical protein